MEQPDIQTLMQMLRSPAGQRLMELVRQQDSPALQKAIAQQDYRQAQTLLSGLTQDPEAQSLLDQLKGS